MIDYYRAAKEGSRRKRRHRTLLILWICFGLLVFGGVLYLLRSPFLRVDGLSVEGVDAIVADSISRDVFSFINNRGWIGHLLFADNSSVRAFFLKNAIENTIQKTFPLVSSVRFSTPFFGGSGVVELSQRERFGLWCGGVASVDVENLVDTPCFWFDRNGVVFLEGPQARGGLLDKLYDPSVSSLQLGDHIFSSDEMDVLIDIFSFLETSHIGTRSLILSDRSRAQISTFDPTLPTFYFSLRQSPLFALKAVEELRSQFDQLHYIDLQVKNRVYYQ